MKGDDRRVRSVCVTLDDGLAYEVIPELDAVVEVTLKVDDDGQRTFAIRGEGRASQFIRRTPLTLWQDVKRVARRVFA